MVGVGQPQWAHTCDECEKIFGPDDANPDAPWGEPAMPEVMWVDTDLCCLVERMNACVMDGVTVGHPRCNVNLCTNRLSSPRDRFCAEHDQENQKCAIHGCDLAIMPGRRTCATPSHQEYEDSKREEGKAIFQLKRRLEKRAMTSALRGLSGDQPDILPPSTTDATTALDDDAVADDADLFDEVVLPSNSIGRPTSKAATDPTATTPANTAKMKAALGRRYTHNEQLCVRCCGVIIGRATFFEAESMSNAYVSNHTQ